MTPPAKRVPESAAVESVPESAAAMSAPELATANSAPDLGTSNSGPDPATAKSPSQPSGSILKRPRLALSLQVADPTERMLLTRHQASRYLRATLDVPADITLRIVGVEEGQALNLEFRGKDYPTNVLTFDYAQEPVVLADLVLCAPVLRREAEELGIAVEAHCAHLIVHGALHALGFDHETDADAAVMEARETQVMQALGFADPYVATSDAATPDVAESAVTQAGRDPAT